MGGDGTGDRARSIICALCACLSVRDDYVTRRFAGGRSNLGYFCTMRSSACAFPLGSACIPHRHTAPGPTHTPHTQPRFSNRKGRAIKKKVVTTIQHSSFQLIL
jgi:hypothetical protein